MPPKPNTKVTKILMSELMFLCEWDKCDQVFKTMEDFLSHMTQHLMVLHNQCKLELEGMYSHNKHQTFPQDVQGIL